MCGEADEDDSQEGGHLRSKFNDLDVREGCVISSLKGIIIVLLNVICFVVIINTRTPPCHLMYNKINVAYLVY